MNFNHFQRKRLIWCNLNFYLAAYSTTISDFVQTKHHNVSHSHYLFYSVIFRSLCLMGLSITVFNIGWYNKYLYYHYSSTEHPGSLLLFKHIPPAMSSVLLELKPVLKLYRYLHSTMVLLIITFINVRNMENYNIPNYIANNTHVPLYIQYKF